MRNVLALLLIATVFACQPERKNNNASLEGTNAVQAPVNIQLQCESISENEEDPMYSVYAIVDDNKAKVAEIAVCEQISADAYNQYQIPLEALTAVGGWWAGYGSYIYATRSEDSSISIYLAEAGSSANESGLTTKKIATFANGNFVFEDGVQ